MKTQFTHFLRLRGIFLLLFFMAGLFASAQLVPEYMYYKFDAAGNQQNFASAPVGNNPATLTGLTIGGTGQFGTALQGNATGSNYLNTGWITSLPSTGWTISMWVNNVSDGGGDAQYLFGDNTATSFRCFADGVALPNNLILRGGGLTDITVTGIAPGAHVVTFVYTGTSMKWFRDGVLGGTVAQPTVTITGTGPFTVGSYSTSIGMPVGGLMDEFRLYNRPLSDAEVAATWDKQLPVGGPPIVVTTAATAVTSSTATLNGTVDANNASTTVTFEYGLDLSYGTTVAGVPGTVTGNTVTPVSAGITGLLPGTTYHYRVKGVNSFGSSNGLDMTFTTAAILPVVITTAATGINSTGATLNGTINAGGASTTVTFEYGPTIAYGTTVPGVPGTVNGNTTTPVSATIGGLIINTTYHYRVKGVNSVGTANGNDMTFVTTSCPPPGAAGAISGSGSACANSVGNLYSVPAISGATGYTWTLPAGSIITAGSNTNSITVTFGTTSGTISVYGTNTCGSGLPSSLPVTINPAPVPTISGVNNLCLNSGTYYYSTQTGKNNYVWTISAGGTIVAGQGTSQIEVNWNAAGAQFIGVNYANPNGCSAGTPTIFPVTVAGMPGTAGSISGTSNVCFGSTGVAYSVAAIDNAQSYVWNLPAGATIATGFGTNNITVNFATNASSGNITVYGNSLCGNGPLSPAYYVLVTNLPGTPLAIIGPTSVCEAETGVPFSVPPITEATGYNWTLPAGATIASGYNTESITVDFAMGASSGPIAVNGTNFCGSGPVSANLEVTVIDKPDAPVITLTGEMLSSDAPLGNQWYYNGVPITGGTAQTEPVLYSGWYWDVVTIDGCSSDTSNNIYYIVTGIENPQASNLSIVPVPNNGYFKISVLYPVEQSFSIRIYNQIGVAVYESLDNRVKGLFEKNIDLRPVPAGIYTVVLQSADYRLVRKIIVN
jgi:hypothetical protein